MSILETVELVIGTISNTVWPIFLPLVMVVGLFLIIRTFTVIQPQTTKPAKVDAAHIPGPAVISLGAMIGTGAIIGVLGSCSKLVGAGQVQLEALLLSGAFSDKESALAYFKDLADGVVAEAEILGKLSDIEGFCGYEGWQIVPMEDETGYDVYLLGSYKPTLERFFRSKPMTHLVAVNLGLDLCAALSVCRRNGYLYVDLKPSNVFITANREYRIGDLGFIHMDSLKYASMPERYHSVYTAPEITDAYASLNETLDVFSVGMILYQAYNNGQLPDLSQFPAQPLTPPMYADYEMAQIILKACSIDPAERWESPAQMGQELVSYSPQVKSDLLPIFIKFYWNIAKPIH